MAGCSRSCAEVECVAEGSLSAGLGCRSITRRCSVQCTGKVAVEQPSRLSVQVLDPLSGGDLGEGCQSRRVKVLRVGDAENQQREERQCCSAIASMLPA